MLGIAQMLHSSSQKRGKGSVLSGRDGVRNLCLGELRLWLMSVDHIFVLGLSALPAQTDSEGRAYLRSLHLTGVETVTRMRLLGDLGERGQLVPLRVGCSLTWKDLWADVGGQWAGPVIHQQCHQQGQSPTATSAEAGSANCFCEKTDEGL